MKYLLIILSVIIGIVLAVLLLIFILYTYLCKTVGSSNMKQLIESAKHYKEREQEYYSSPKNLSSMTSLIEPRIKDAFPGFNKEQIFNDQEENIREILNSLESKKTSNIKNKSLSFIKDKVERDIETLNDKNKKVEFKNIKFNKHAFRDYTNESGAAVLTVITSLSYFYDSNDDADIKYKDIRKETRYQLKYIYVYDEDKIVEGMKMIGVNCPNCGAPIDFFGRGTCSYCSSNVEPINLKNWKVIAYEEY